MSDCFIPVLHDGSGQPVQWRTRWAVGDRVQRHSLLIFILDTATGWTTADETLSPPDAPASAPARDFTPVQGVPGDAPLYWPQKPAS